MLALELQRMGDRGADTKLNFKAREPRGGMLRCSEPLERLTTRKFVPIRSDESLRSMPEQGAGSFGHWRHLGTQMDVPGRVAGFATLSPIWTLTKHTAASPPLTQQSRVDSIFGVPSLLPAHRLSPRDVGTGTGAVEDSWLRLSSTP
jgi:hypothetical protein